MGNVFGKVPAYTTIGFWTQELGLSVYKESCSLFKDKRYALIVDESMISRKVWRLYFCIRTGRF